jgi:hypothetical protein
MAFGFFTVDELGTSDQSEPHGTAVGPGFRSGATPAETGLPPRARLTESRRNATPATADRPRAPLREELTGFTSRC